MEQQIRLRQRQAVFLGGGFQAVIQQLPLPERVVQQPLPGQGAGMDLGALISKPGGEGQHGAVLGGVNEEAVYLQPPLVLRLVQHSLVELIVVLKEHQLGAHGFGNAQPLAGQRALGLDIVVYGHLEGKKPFGVTDIFQVEQEVLAPADGRVHLQTVLHDDIPAVELVPQYAVVKIGGVFHHVGGELLPGKGAVLINIPFGGHALPHHPVKIGDHHVAAVLPGGTHQQLGGVGGDPVVGVQKLQVLPPGLGHGLVAGVGHP